jgi:hypothetical protein
MAGPGIEEIFGNKGTHKPNQSRCAGRWELKFMIQLPLASTNTL